MVSEDNVFALEFSSVAKSLKALVDADAANIDVMNVVQIAFARELEAQNQISERRDQLFNHNVKL